MFQNFSWAASWLRGAEGMAGEFVWPDGVKLEFLFVWAAAWPKQGSPKNPTALTNADHRKQDR
jgi:hypothetical protein